LLPVCSAPVRAEVNESGSALAIDALSQVKHVLLPITDRNPYLSEGTRQVCSLFPMFMSLLFVTSLLIEYIEHIYTPQVGFGSHVIGISGAV
jgi:hypothetical protein